jgi:hypothetical protein
VDNGTCPIEEEEEARRKEDDEALEEEDVLQSRPPRPPPEPHNYTMPREGRDDGRLDFSHVLHPVTNVPLPLDQDGMNVIHIAILLKPCGDPELPHQGVPHYVARQWDEDNVEHHRHWYYWIHHCFVAKDNHGKREGVQFITLPEHRCVSYTIVLVSSLWAPTAPSSQVVVHRNLSLNPPPHPTQPTFPHAPKGGAEFTPSNASPTRHSRSSECRRASTAPQLRR